MTGAVVNAVFDNVNDMARLPKPIRAVGCGMGEDISGSAP